MATEERLPGSGPAEFQASGLAEAIRRRGGVELYVDFGEGRTPYTSGFAVAGTPDLVDADLKEIVASGRLGWQWLDLAGDPYLVVGGHRDVAPTSTSSSRPAMWPRRLPACGRRW